jgi:hypothetical protein
MLVNRLYTQTKTNSKQRYTMQQLRSTHLYFLTEHEEVYRCPRTRSAEKRGKIFIKGQINNPNEIFFYLERYSRKEQFNSTNQSILSHPGLFPVVVTRLHIYVLINDRL